MGTVSDAVVVVIITIRTSTSTGSARPQGYAYVPPSLVVITLPDTRHVQYVGTSSASLPAMPFFLFPLGSFCCSVVNLVFIRRFPRLARRNVYIFIFRFFFLFTSGACSTMTGHEGRKEQWLCVQ
jgi:hypothetical protein